MMMVDLKLWVRVVLKRHSFRSKRLGLLPALSMAGLLPMRSISLILRLWLMIHSRLASRSFCLADAARVMLQNVMQKFRQ